MNKTKLKHILTVLLVVVLAFVVAISAVACDNDHNHHDDTQQTPDPAPSTDESNEETLLITNGRFNDTTSSVAPYGVKGWTSPSSSNGAVFGIVDLDETKYSTTNSAWDSLANPGSANTEADNKALMLYNKELAATSYKLTESLVIPVGAYYQISVSYRVVSAASEPAGKAYVMFSKDALATFELSAESTWKTVNFFVEGSQIAEQKLDITLALGTEAQKANGYVFFDDVVVKTFETKTAYTEALNATTDRQAYSMLTPDADFINAEEVVNTVNRSNAYGWTGSTGTGKGNASISSNVLHGVLNMTKEDTFSKWTNNWPTTIDNPGLAGEFADGHILAISNLKSLPTASDTKKSFAEAFTAYGYKGKRAINIEPNTYYTLSVWAYADISNYDDVKALFDGKDDKIDEAIDCSAAGANIILTGAADAKFASIKEKSWKQYTFVILGTNTTSKQINMELWLGLGGQGDNTRTNGAVFFDKIELTNLGTINDREAIKANYASAVYTQVVDLMPEDGANQITNGSFADKDAAVDMVLPSNNYNANADDVVIDVLDIASLTNTFTKGATESDEAYEARIAEVKNTLGIDSNPGTPYASFNNVLMVNQKMPGAYQIKSNTFAMLPNAYYRVSALIKTNNVAKENGIELILRNAKDDSVVNSSLNYTKASSSSDDRINSVVYTKSARNGYAQVEMYIRTKDLASVNAGLEDDTVNAYLEINFGKGSNYSTADFVKGEMYIAGISAERVSSKEYADKGVSNKTAGLLVKSADLSTATGAIRNGSFNNIEIDDKLIGVDGMQTDLLKPTTWKLENTDNDSIKSGVLNVNASNLLASLGLPSGNGLFDSDTIGTTTDGKYSAKDGAPNVFMAYTTGDISASKVLSYSGITVARNNYYLIKAYVRADDAVAQLVITFKNGNEPITKNVPADGMWHEVNLYVQAGTLGSTTCELALYIGDKDADSSTKYNGKVFMDSVSCISLTKDVFLALAGNDYLNFVTETFGTTDTSTTSLVTPGSVWTTTGDTADKSLVKGIYTKLYTGDLNYNVDTVDAEGATVSTPDAEKVLKQADIFDLSGLEGDVLGDSVLVINNPKASYNGYKLNSSISVSAGKTYRLSMLARTFHLAEEDNALIRITFGGATYEIQVNTEYNNVLDENGKVTSNKEKGANAWKEINFYLKGEADKAADLVIYMLLGSDSDKVQGTLAIDNVKLEEISDTDYATAYAKFYDLDGNGKALIENDAKVEAEGADVEKLTSLAVNLSDKLTVKEPEKEPDHSDETNTSDDKNKVNDQLWLYISTLVLAVAIIVVVAIFLIRKFLPKHKNMAPKKVTYGRENADKPVKKEEKAETDSTEYDD